MLREHEKFWAFLALGLGVLVIVFLAVLYPPEKDQVVRLMDAALGGFLLALGSAANALFRIGTPADERLKETAASVVQSNAPPAPVSIQQPTDKPVPVIEAGEPDDPVPPMMRS